MDINTFYTLREGAIGRVSIKDITFLFAKSSSKTSHTRSVKGSYYFSVPIHLVTEDDREADYVCNMKFVPRIRDYFIYKLFEPGEDSGLLDGKDALITYMNGRPNGEIGDEHLNEYRLRKIKQFLVEFFQHSGEWCKGGQFVYRENEYGKVHIQGLAELQPSLVV